jgi:hypothetical protein
MFCRGDGLCHEKGTTGAPGDGTAGPNTAEKRCGTVHYTIAEIGTEFALEDAGRWSMERNVNPLGDIYRARCGSGFDAYMTLQCALLTRWLARGGTVDGWCDRIAPLFRLRYGGLVEGGGV